MWSESYFNEYSTFYGQYALELLHSLGCIFDNAYSNNENLRNKMIHLAKQNDYCFYELAFEAYKRLQQNKSFNLTTVFNEQTLSAQPNFNRNDRENPVS